MYNDKYFAADEPEKLVSYLDGKASDWFRIMQYNRYLDKIKRSWASYHGVYYDDAHMVSFGGEQGELVNLAINHYRNIAQVTLNMVTASRPAFQARSINSDKTSQVQAKLANGLLDYYMREKRLERILKSAVEQAIVLGTGYVKMEWNSTRGEIYDYVEPDPDSIKDYDENGNPLDEDGNEIKSYPIYEGDVEFSNLTPFDVIFDTTKESPEQHDWVLCRTFVNKFDLIAKYPEMKEKILTVATKDQVEGSRLTLSPYDETQDVPVYEFYHKRTEALPNGRYTLYLDGDIVLVDSVMPYRTLPVFRIAPSDILGTPYGYTSMFDLLPMQDSINSLYSTVMTNQTAFGVQNILNPRGNDVKVNQLEGGLNFIEYNSQAGKPEPLNLTNTPGEIFNFIQMLEKSMETVSGINSVARGNPESSLKSGNALALVQSQALQFISGLQQSYIQLVEDTGTGLINLLKDFASVPRVAAIAGINNRTQMKEFSGDDLKSINRVVVDAGNALMQTTAGRSQIAENLLQMGILTSPEQYLQVMNTGNLDTMIDGEINELHQIKGENERLINGEDVIAVATDNHSLHIREHREVLADQDHRRDPDLTARTLAHIQEHIDLLRTTDPDLLAIIGQQPLSPAPNSVNPQNVAPGQPPANMEGVADTMANPQAATVDASGNPLPQPAKPAGNPNLPTDPAVLLAQNAGSR